MNSDNVKKSIVEIEELTESELENIRGGRTSGVGPRANDGDDAENY